MRKGFPLSAGGRLLWSGCKEGVFQEEEGNEGEEEEEEEEPAGIRKLLGLLRLQPLLCHFKN